MAQPVNSYRYEYWTRTSGDLKDRRTPIGVPHIVSTPGDAVKIVVDPTQEYQMWEGAGAAITDSSASLFMNSMTSEQRHAILTEMFDPEQGGFSSVRMSIGACDFSSQKYYTYDDLPDGVAADAALEHLPAGTGGARGSGCYPRHEECCAGASGKSSINPAVRRLWPPMECSGLDEDIQPHRRFRALAAENTSAMAIVTKTPLMTMCPVISSNSSRRTPSSGFTSLL